MSIIEVTLQTLQANKHQGDLKCKPASLRKVSAKTVTKALHTVANSKEKVLREQIVFRKEKGTKTSHFFFPKNLDKNSFLKQAFA